MDSELPGNSHRRQSVQTEKVTKTVKVEKVPVKKVEKVILTDVTRRKPPMGKRFAQTFIGGHAKSAWEFVLMDVLVPAAKNMIADSVSQGVERMVYGDAYRPTDRRRSGGGHIQRGAGSTLISGHTSYDRMSDPRARREEPRMVSRGRHDFDDVILASRAEAEMVIQSMYELLDLYEQVTVADLYELVGETGSFTDERWGWLDLQGIDARRERGGEYRLVLPRTVSLSK